uniref:Uncharacterized protein n=1 Tax=Glossina austeni TaxID=7395 RepID=A0A1A9VYX2_GLOAU
MLDILSPQCGQQEDFSRTYNSQKGLYSKYIVDQTNGTNHNNQKNRKNKKLQHFTFPDISIFKFAFRLEVGFKNSCNSSNNFMKTLVHHHHHHHHQVKENKAQCEAEADSFCNFKYMRGMRGIEFIERSYISQKLRNICGTYVLSAKYENQNFVLLSSDDNSIIEKCRQEDDQILATCIEVREDCETYNRVLGEITSELTI